MNYENLLREMRSLAEHVSYPITNLANASALLFEEMDRLNWAGFYIRQGEELLLGPFQGKVACTRIPLGKGVCGTAAKSGQTQLVKDVGTLLEGEEAVKEGLIDEVGGIREALMKLHQMIETNREKSGEKL